MFFFNVLCDFDSSGYRLLKYTNNSLIQLQTSLHLISRAKISHRRIGFVLQ